MIPRRDQRLALTPLSVKTGARVAYKRRSFGGSGAPSNAASAGEAVPCTTGVATNPLT